MIKAVIFDLNGIFIKSPKLSSRFEKDFGISHEVFLPKLSWIMDQVRKPNAQKAFNYWEPVLRSWGLKMSEEEFWEYWFNAEKPDEEVIELAGKLRNSGIKVIILSNNFNERSEYYNHYPWLHSSVDRVYFSWQTGFIKPDPKAWELVLKDNSLLPEEVLYCDDQDKNVAVAEGLGIKSYLYDNIVGFKDYLNKFMIV